MPDMESGPAQPFGDGEPLDWSEVDRWNEDNPNLFLSMTNSEIDGYVFQIREEKVVATTVLGKAPDGISEQLALDTALSMIRGLKS